MYRPEIKRKRSGAPVLSRKEIDVIGQNIVGDFMPEALKSPQEIDIDLLEILIVGTGLSGNGSGLSVPVSLWCLSWYDGVQ